MNSTEAIRNYKHDIAGKFKDISMAINSLDESSFNDPEAHEIFHAVHEVVLKMLKTSRNTIESNLNQEIELVVIDGQPDTSLPKLQIEGMTIRYQLNDSKMRYIYSQSENQGSLEIHIETLKTVLPLRVVKYDGVHGIAKKFLKDLRQEQ